VKGQDEWGRGIEAIHTVETGWEGGIPRSILLLLSVYPLNIRGFYPNNEIETRFARVSCCSIPSQGKQAEEACLDHHTL
jgi:hypothetical protein